MAEDVAAASASSSDGAGRTGGKPSRAGRNLPLAIGVGLGVGNGAQAAEVAAFADGVIVGSALIRCMLEAPDRATGLADLRALSTELAEGVRARQ